MQPESVISEQVSLEAIKWVGNRRLRVLDQRRLPDLIVYRECSSAVDVAEAITCMTVRGASAIGIAAAYGVVLAAMAVETSDDWEAALAADFAMLEQTRPTARSLSWALDIMRETLRQTLRQTLHPLPVQLDVPARLLQAAIAVHDSDREANRSMARLGMQMIGRRQKKAQKIMVHGNAGALGSGGYGSALGVVRAAHEAGLVDEVYVSETRPWLQGSRLTAWELAQAGIPAQLHVDSAAAHLMKNQNIAWVVVAADRIAANGDAICKMGTYALAVLAMHHGLRFMVVAPTTCVDLALEVGDDQPLEQRSSRELLRLGERNIDTGVAVNNTIFDVTPADLIDVIVTEKGAVERPDGRKLADLVSHRRLH
ncbi:MAG: S-methyl-5-thioribose-1-phosphate isomerase [Halopseudomonas sp.]|uniref:S-methyl-5-thioribose-1-phosphate isomerase n=1 Tax=Halopseudomonas sp. TaxID=2901191 RepID=UPI00300255D2